MEEKNGHRFGGLNHVTNQSDKRNIVTYSSDEAVSQLHSGDPKQDLSIKVVPRGADWVEFITPLMEEHELVDRSVVFVKKLVKPKLETIVVLRRVENPFDSTKREESTEKAEYMERVAEAKDHHTSLPT